MKTENDRNIDNLRNENILEIKIPEMKTTSKNVNIFKTSWG